MFLQSVRQMSSRVPLIKFRQGGLPSHGTESSSVGKSAAAGAQGKPNKVKTPAVIEDWQLPPRYRRRPISDEECEAINMGGAL